MEAFDIRYNQARAILQKEFCIANVMQVPSIEKITVNMGMANLLGDSKKIQAAMNELGLIVAQKPVVTYARKSIAAFKLREGQQTGCRVTLRNKKMKSFFDRLVFLALPRVRDFRGISSKSFDGNGNLSLGIKEHIVFPEIDYDKIDSVKGMDVTIVTTIPSDEVSRRFLELLGLPFRQ
jgi:large subunit ribosomal protein L5